MQSARSNRPLRRLLTLASLALVLATFANSAHAGISSRRQLAAILSQTPAAQIVCEGHQMEQAEQAAAQIPGAQTFWGVGQSMQPLYTPNTALVVKTMSYGAIKKGMTVVYVKKNGRVVAHSVIDEDAKGYVVQGVNNDEADAESVNEHNMIGVVVAAYASADNPLRAELAKTIAARAPMMVANRG
jgi:signal peptidase I